MGVLRERKLGFNDQCAIAELKGRAGPKMAELFTPCFKRAGVRSPVEKEIPSYKA